MPINFPAPAADFIGRDEYITRFVARFRHFRFFIYEGLPGIGKTALLQRLAAEGQSLNLSGSLYIRLNPGEGIHSIAARVESHLRNTPITAQDVLQGDPYARLVGTLHAHKAILILDGLHFLRPEELPTLTRQFHARPGDYRIISATRTDPGLSAMDRGLLHYERVGGLTRKEVKTWLDNANVGGESAEVLLADAARGGSTTHPLTLCYLLALRRNDTPPKEFLSKYSARSVTAFKALLDLWNDRLDPLSVQTLKALSRVGVPLALQVAQKAFGETIDTLRARHLIDVIDGEVQVHLLVTQALGSDVVLEISAAKVIADHLKASAIKHSAPLSLIRAGELLAHAGMAEEAIETLSSGWDAIRDLDFLEAYLKTLASVPANDMLKSRLNMLSARARMRRGQPGTNLTAEMERLALAPDLWTKSRALDSLVYLHNLQGDDQKALAAYETLQGVSDDPDLLLSAGSTAANAMLRVGQVSQAENLARKLLKRIVGHNQPEREGKLHRLLSQVYDQSGNLSEAIVQAKAAASCFDAALDFYRAATTYGFIGDLWREAGEFEQAKEAFKVFREAAARCGERDLIHIAQLADAWVSLDIGDMAHAARQIAAVEQELTVSPSTRLKRHLLAAKALLEVGRGHHDIAADALQTVARMWEKVNQPHIADYLRAQQVRSLIACDKLDEAQSIVDGALQKLDVETAAPRVAAFLRESALIHLRRKEVPKALEELSRAQQLFAQGGNRREEALTLHRIARAAVDEGDLELGEARAQEALDLARKIKHDRVIALAREVQGRAALERNNAKEAVTAFKEALQSLRKLGDEVGALHVAEGLLRALIVGGDFANALKLGPKVREEAERLEVREIRVRSIVYTGIALLRRGRHETALKCFKEFSERAYSPWTRALMWRFGEALASVVGNRADVLNRRMQWSNAVRKLPDNRQVWALAALEQLALPPRDKCELRTRKSNTTLGAEQLAWFDPTAYDTVIDLLDERVIERDATITFDAQSDDVKRLWQRVAMAAPRNLPVETAVKMLGVRGDADGDKRTKSVVKTLQKLLKDSKQLDVALDTKEIKLTLPRSFAVLVPIGLAKPEMSAEQRKVIEYLTQHGQVSLQTLQDTLELNRNTAKKQLGELVEAGLVEAIRDGRGQSYRLA